MSQTNSYAGTQSVVRVLRLLKLFGGRQSLWSLQELVAASDLNKTTVFRMLTALESEGLVEKTATGHYRLGAAMLTLGARAVGNVDVRTLAQPYLRELTQRINERSTLELLVQNETGYAMLILDELPCQHLIGINNVIGNQVPVHSTSTGKAILAFLDEAARARILPATATTIDFAAIRAQGYALAAGELEVGLMACGTPIFDHTGRPIAAISLEAPDIRVDEAQLHQMAAELVKTAQEISARLGHRPKL